jgi:acyl transferase domain-containing protein/phosphopantetheinyl transferase
MSPFDDRDKRHLKKGRQVAIVGMSCLFPDAPDLASFWRNVVSGKDSIRDVSPDEWDEGVYFSRSPQSFEQSYCKRGGFISDLAYFDPLKYGVMPNALPGADADQFLSLRVAAEALADAGYYDKSFDGERAEVILGRVSAPGAGAMNMIQHGQTLEQMLAVVARVRPDLDRASLDQIRASLKDSLRPCNADTIPGVMPNILAGRIASRLGIRGRSMILDAACASSLIAVETGVRDLASGACDMVLAGGLHVNSFACFYQMFCGLGALAASGQIRPFDQDADGTLLGEGIGIVVLKRREDAERDGDRIYAVITGVGTSSDGYGGSVVAPSLEGESLALKRAYEMADVSPRTIALLEAHGTGTPVGDVIELRAIEKVFQSKDLAISKEAGSGSALELDSKWCAIGSVKSMIGHCQAASGVAGLIKAALSLHYKLLPPTLNVKQPTDQIDWERFPCYINNRARPWIHPVIACEQEHPRRAAVSAFGFGGVNGHAVLEEYGGAPESQGSNLHTAWDTELFTFQGESLADLAGQLERLAVSLAGRNSLVLKDIAWTVNSRTRQPVTSASGYRAAIVAGSVQELASKLESLRESLSGSQATGKGVYLAVSGLETDGQLAFLLPGLGAAYPNMLADLCIHFPEVRSVFDFVDRLSVKLGDSVLPSSRIFPPPSFGSAAGIQDVLSLATADSAVVLVLMAEWALFTLLSNLGVKPDTVMGCSTGEFAALAANGAIDINEAAELFYRLSTTLARSLPEERLKNLRSIKVAASSDSLADLWVGLPEKVYLSADLTYTQAIVSGSELAIEAACQRLKAAEIDFTRLPIAIPYHTPLVANILDKQENELLSLPIAGPSLKSWSCSIPGTYPAGSEAIREIATELFERPIQLRRTVEAMYADGVRCFVEVGPKGNLTELVKEILGDRPHFSMASNVPGVSSITQLHHLLAALFCQGRNLDLDYLYRRRSPTKLDLDSATDSVVSSPKGIRLAMSFPEFKLDAFPDTFAGGRTEPGDQLTAQAGNGEIAESWPSVTALESLDGVSAPVPDPLSTFLSGLSSFHGQLMAVQEKVMTEYLKGQQSNQVEAVDRDDFVQLCSGVETTRYPFLEGAAICRGVDCIEVVRRFALDRDLYLKDHAIGGVVANSYGLDEKVYLVPLMVTLEVMAESAALLAGQLVLTKMIDIRAYKRIRVDAQGTTIKVTARWKDVANGIANVEVRSCPSLEPDGAGSNSYLLACCDIVFESCYPAAALEPILEMEQEQPSRFGSKGLYGPQAMFHGPTMQAVRAVTRVGRREIVGSVAVRRPFGWFASDPNCEGKQGFIVDPLLLDNASQLVLFHLFEHAMPVKALLPFSIESVEFFGASRNQTGTATVQARLLAITDVTTHANVEIADADGGNGTALIARIAGISSRRIATEDVLSRFIAEPARQKIAQELPLATAGFSPRENIACFKLAGDLVPLDRAFVDWLADYVLSGAEREFFQFELKSDQRKREWLIGRMAAKDAVRTLIARDYGLELCPADIEILQSDSGQPVLSGNWLSLVPCAPTVSIAHKGDLAVAVASGAAGLKRIGVDLEELRQLPAGFAELGLKGRAVLPAEKLPEPERSEAHLAMWCAREAFGKALGIGLADQMSKIEIDEIDLSAGQVALHLMALSDGAAPGGRVFVEVRKIDKHVLAIAECQHVLDR